MNLRQMRGWLMRIAGFFKYDKSERELTEELESHIQMHIEDNLRSGMTAEEARRRALIKLGGVEQVKEAYRQRIGLPVLETVLQDLRYGCRMLIQKPTFTLIAVLMLAMGIGANAAIFSVVNALLLRPLPYVEAERLVLLAERARTGERLSASYPNFADWQVRAQSFEGMAASHPRSFILTGEDKAARVRGRAINWNFFQLLGVQPQRGRLFTEADDRYGAARTVMVSHGFWQGHLGGDTNIIGQTLRLTGETYTVIGVLPPGFEYFTAEELYAPLNLFVTPDSDFLDRGSSAAGFYAVARLKSGVTLKQANSEMEALGQQLAREYPKVNEGKSAQAERLQDVMSESVRQSLWVLLGAVGFILLIACINVANLLLVRASERQKELAVRLALGAGRGRIVRQLLSESLLIAALGGACGLLLGHWMLQGLLALAPPEIPQLSRVGMDNNVLLSMLGLAALTSLLFGLLPALQASKTDIHIMLKDGGRQTIGVARGNMRRALLIAEVSLSLVLLAGAGLLLRSMYNLQHVELGFNANKLLTLRLSLAGGRYNDQTARGFYDECLARVQAVPGVHSVALAHSLPIQGTNWSSVFIAADKPVPSRADLPESDYLRVSPNYFETLGIHLLRGRLFTVTDTPDSTPVIIINETLARRIWPGEDPIGKHVKLGLPEEEAPWCEVIGVVNDVKMNGAAQATTLQTYRPFSQMPGESLGLLVRAERNPAALAPAVEQAIHAIDKDLPIFSIFTMDQLLGNSLATRRLTMILLVSFAVLALLLAAFGIYGVIAYMVRQRTHELGIRLALGAQAGDVLKLILTQGLKLALIGVVIGLAAAFALTRWMESLLFGVRPTDPMTFCLIAVVLLCLALLACWIPARRATKVDPLVALRYE
ncbi:MAG: ABC transporter permease [Acidobacteriota bacterium]